MNLEHSVRLKKGVRRRDDEEEGKWPDKTRQIINNYFIDPSFVVLQMRILVFEIFYIDDVSGLNSIVKKRYFYSILQSRKIKVNTIIKIIQGTYSHPLSASPQGLGCLKETILLLSRET